MSVCQVCSQHWCYGIQLLRRLTRLRILHTRQLSDFKNSNTFSQQEKQTIFKTRHFTKILTEPQVLTIPSYFSTLANFKLEKAVLPVQNVTPTSSHWMLSQNYVSKSHANDVEINKLRKNLSCLRQQNCRYVLKTDFAKVMKDKIWPGDSLKNEKSQIVELSAGPGILTRHLLEGGVNNLIVVEKEKELVSLLNQLEPDPGKSYQVVSGDYITVLRTLKTFKDAKLDLSAIFEQKVGFNDWQREPLVKVVGSIAMKKTERSNLFSLVNLLLQKLGIFKFGPVEFNLLMFQRTLETIVQAPTSNMFRYQAISVLVQIGFNVECLHTVSHSSLLFQDSVSKLKNENVCLVRLTPRSELITENGLSSDEASLFIYFVRNMMTKRKQNLLQMLEVWAPGNGNVLIDLGYNKHTRTGDVKPMDYLRMFTRILQLDSFNGHWIGEEIMDNSAIANDIENSVLQDMY